jgi:hypothetical protein
LDTTRRTSSSAQASCEIEHFITLVITSDDLSDLNFERSILRFDEIYGYSISRDQEGFINFMGHDVSSTLSVVDNDRKPA